MVELVVQYLTKSNFAEIALHQYNLMEEEPAKKKNYNNNNNNNSNVTVFTLKGDSLSVKIYINIKK